MEGRSDYQYVLLGTDQNGNDFGVSKELYESPEYDACINEYIRAGYIINFKDGVRLPLKLQKCEGENFGKEVIIPLDRLKMWYDGLIRIKLD